jgi:hypothetical protein
VTGKPVGEGSRRRGGTSDANHPSGRRGGRLLDAAARPRQSQSAAAEIGLEIGGSGARAAAPSTSSLDAQCGTNFYSRLHFILGDYSPTSLERALQAVAHHGEHVSGIPLDALNPEKSLTKYRFKLMYVHLTNVYDNLPFDDLVRRDGKLYLVEVRAYLNGPAVDRLTADFGLTREELPGIVKKLLEEGPTRSTRVRRASTSWVASGTPSNSSACACSTIAKRIVHRA